MGLGLGLGSGLGLGRVRGSSVSGVPAAVAASNSASRGSEGAKLGPSTSRRKRRTGTLTLRGGQG